MKTKHIDPSDVDIDFLKSEFNRFRSEISGMKDKISGGATDALDQISAYLNGSGLSSRIASLESELEYLAGKVKGSSKQAVNKLESQVTERPIASIAIAFGVGLIASQLIRRS